MPESTGIKQRWNDIKTRVNNSVIGCGRQPTDINIIAVSKTYPVDLILEGIDAGIRLFGENYVQELKDKHDFLNSKQILQPEWHFIGHLQRNKVKYIAPFISMIHSVDTFQLAQEISEEALKNERIIDILLQANTSGEESKFGCEPDKIFNLYESIMPFKNINVKGLMTIGSFTNDKELILREFRLLRSLKDKINVKFGIKLEHLSMGMTGDFELAITEGATYVRIGTAIFGERNYKQ
ncbi:MAG: YggS family pyridoxal phosphate-dependent enzyme [FCB group bacterium]